MKSFSEFWFFYLNEHKNKTNRILHAVGTLLGITILAYALIYNLYFIVLAPIVAYSFAWAGHFLIEKNKPATFKYPFRSLLADFKLIFFVILEVISDIKKAIS
ncbi:MAG: DUF962 domain-containing protein [Oligoflexia bacterium]|nr:DUF962 domain-containing protein [Oligoflexia bacterium]